MIVSSVRVSVRASADMCPFACVRACACEEGEDATYWRLVRPLNTVAGSETSSLPDRPRYLWMGFREQADPE